MSSTGFFPAAITLTIARVCEIAGVAVPSGADGLEPLHGIAALGWAGPHDLSYMDNPRYLDELASTRARACLTSQRFAARVPPGTVAIVCREPYRAFGRVMAELHPTAMRPQNVFGIAGVAPGAFVHPAARLETGVTVDPGVVIGEGAEIGSGTIIGAGSVIGPGVMIGRNCSIAPNVTVQAAFLGNRVILHPGVRIGQDGFGFAMGRGGHAKVPQIGRVIIQDDVEIGANSCVDRGASRDTVIGEGTKIDNLVQIGHNVSIGRHCVIVAQVGISGSTTLSDFVVVGGQAGFVGHVTVGRGAQVAGASHVTTDMPAGERWAGTPAKPLRTWMREMGMLARLGRRGRANGAKTEEKGEGPDE